MKGTSCDSWTPSLLRTLHLQTVLSYSCASDWSPRSVRRDEAERMGCVGGQLSRVGIRLCQYNSPKPAPSLKEVFNITTISSFTVQCERMVRHRIASIPPLQLAMSIYTTSVRSIIVLGLL